MEKQTKTEQYVLGMQAINNFYSMLYRAMREAMPEAQLIRNGAYGWRGYQIKHYEDLVPNQYYCEIYPNNSKETCVVVFQESYKDRSHKPFDIYERGLRIWAGEYCYPFRVSLDLYRVRFFHLDVNEQYALLRNFVSYAAQQALIWQHSKFRTEITNPRFSMNSNIPIKRNKAKVSEIQPVGIAFMNAWNIQNDVFIKLKDMLSIYLPHVPQNEKDWIRPNAHPSHFDFRGYFVKTGKLLPGAFDIRWQIFYEKPESLYCLTSEKELIEKYNMINQHYFDLPSEQQKGELTGFIKECLDRF